MIFKATINQSYVMLSHPNDPRNLCAESLYPFPLWFPEWEIEVNWLFAWGNSRYFAPPPLISPPERGQKFHTDDVSLPRSE